jgi:hypothetical protein
MTGYSLGWEAISPTNNQIMMHRLNYAKQRALALRKEDGWS